MKHGRSIRSTDCNCFYAGFYHVLVVVFAYSKFCNLFVTLSFPVSYISDDISCVNLIVAWN